MKHDIKQLRKKVTAFGVVCIGLACPAVRGDHTTAPALTLEPVMVTARGYASPVDRVPGGASTVSAETLSRISPVSASDAIARLPGVERVADSPWGADVNIRGLGRDAVVFLIDGNRVETANDIAGRFGFVHPMEIERVDVLKGPISALYGSGALGGVVNVITRRAHFSEVPTAWSSCRAEYGDNADTRSAYAHGAAERSDVYLYTGIGYREAGDYEDGSGTMVRNSGYEDRHVKFSTGWKPAPAQSLLAQVHYAEGREIGIPGSGTAPLPESADVTYPRARRFMADVAYVGLPGLGPWAETKLRVFRQHVDRRARIDEFPDASPVERIAPGANHHTTGGRWENRLETARHIWFTGIDVWRRDLESFRTRIFRDGRTADDTPLPESSFFSGGLFAEDTWQCGDRLALTIGGRGDFIRVDNEATEQWEARDTDEFSGNAQLGAVYDVADIWSLQGVVARGYRAASLEERYTYLELGGGQVKYGNPDLDPEESRFAEIGLRRNGERLRGHLSFFYNDLDNMISEKRRDERVLVNANVQEAEIYGAETEAQWRWADGWHIYGQAAWTVGRDTRNDEDLSQIPPVNGRAGIQYDHDDGFWGYIETPFAMEQNDAPEGVMESGAWMTCNARLGWRQAYGRSHVMLYAGAENLFDTAYRNYLTTSRGTVYNEPGRNLVLGCEIRY